MTKRLKILYAASTASHLERFHRPYIEALQREHDVYLMATAGEAIDFPIPFAKKMFSFSNLRALFAVRKILKRESFDRVIVHTSLAAFLIRAAMFGLRNRPYVLNVVHGYLFSLPMTGMRARFLLLCEKLLRSKTDAIAVMNAEDARIAEQYGLCRGQVLFFRGMGLPPCSAPERNSELRRRFLQGEDEILCCFVGELSVRKNQRFLIEAVRRLRDRGYPVRLLLLGEGSERATLEACIAENRLEGAVFLPGDRSPILPYLAATDCYVSASLSEGLPFNVMEAMACGLPMVLSAVKGQTDLMREREDVLYPSGDVEAFCRCFEVWVQKRCRGVGSCFYPELEAYRLEAVFSENLHGMTGGEAHEDLS